MRGSGAELGIATYPVNWPIGCGKEFQGVYDREKQRILFISPTGPRQKAAPPRWSWTIPPAGADWQKLTGILRDDVELLGAGAEFDLEAVQCGKLSPCSSARP